MEVGGEDSPGMCSTSATSEVDVTGDVADVSPDVVI